MKIIGIGLNKTGTTTLGQCLRQLGFSVTSVHMDLLRQIKRGDLRQTFLTMEKFDSFKDWPWPIIYKEIDQQYPGSKFILTTRRDAQTWLNSLKAHAERKGPSESRKLVYGYEMPHGHEAEHIAFYEEHNRRVREYFANRPESLLEVCWETGSGWKELCDFLGVEAPDIPIPHANRKPGFIRRTRLVIGRKLRAARAA